MNGKSILLDALSGRKTPRPAWVPFVGVHGGQLIGVTAEEYLKSSQHIVAGLEKAAELYRPDGLPVVFDLQVEAEILGCDLTWSKDGPPSVTTHPLEMGQALADLPEFSTDRGRFPLIAEAMKTLRASIGDDVALYGLVTGPFTLALHLMGTMIFLEMYDAPEKVTELLRFCADVGRQTARFYIENGADVIAVVDPMTSQISAEHFQQFVSPHVNAIFDDARDHNAFTSLFVCGDATRNLEVMSDTTCDNISVDENIDLEAFAGLARSKGKSVGGNLKLTTVLLLGTEIDARRDTLRCLDTGGDSGFVLAPGCDIPWGVAPENLQAVTDLVHDPYSRDVARQTLTAPTDDTFDDVKIMDYQGGATVHVDVVTLDSASCPPCQYMLAAAERAAARAGSDVVVHERKIKNREGLAYMKKLGVQAIPTICIQGKPVFSSIIPDDDKLVKAVREPMEVGS